VPQARFFLLTFFIVIFFLLCPFLGLFFFFLCYCGSFYSFIYLSGFGMAKEAARQVFAQSGGLTPKDVNVYASMTLDFRTPPPSIMISAMHVHPLGFLWWVRGTRAVRCRE
jgi:hypothetical protein